MAGLASPPDRIAESELVRDDFSVDSNPLDSCGCGTKPSALIRTGADTFSRQWDPIGVATTPNCTLSAAASLRSVLGFPRSRHYGR